MGMNTKDIARVCHEANRAYCTVLGDLSQPTWLDAPEWQKTSAKNGVNLHGHGGVPAEVSHKKWCEDKELEGWRHGAEKDVDAKVHPCLVPWNRLPLAQKRKDVLFRAICLALLEDI